MKTIGVFFGSRSPEHDVSIVTGQLIISGLKKLNYNVIPIYIDKKGRWLISDKLGSIKFFTDPSSKLQLSKVKNFYLELAEAAGKQTFQEKSILAKKVSIDLAFPAFHGQNGEDGTFQGMMEMLNIPYVGCDTASSAISMDKVLTKLLYQSKNIPTTKFCDINSQEWFASKKEALQYFKTLKWPLIVKPARLGSSIGISKAKNQKELEFAIEVALHYDTKVIVEEYVDDLMDVTCCLIGNNEPIPSLLQESIFNSEFFSYEEKYLKGGGAQTGNNQKSIVIPARLDKKTTKEIQKAAIEIYKLFGCSGIARVDFLFNKKTNKWYANEINTLPGTLYHHLWKKSGIEFTDLLQKLISFAEEKYQQKKSIIYTFDSNILTQASSTKLSLKGL
jgi:D-alanine-D-alanine ligase